MEKFKSKDKRINQFMLHAEEIATLAVIIDGLVVEIFNRDRYDFTSFKKVNLTLK